MSSLKNKITSDNLVNFIEILGNHIGLVKLNLSPKFLKTSVLTQVMFLNQAK